MNPPQDTNEIDEELVAKNLDEISDIEDGGDKEKEKVAAEEVD